MILDRLTTVTYAITLEDVLRRYTNGEITKKGLVTFFLDIYPDFCPGVSDKEDEKVCVKLGLTKYAFRALVAIIQKERELAIVRILAPSPLRFR